MTVGSVKTWATILATAEITRTESLQRDTPQAGENADAG